MRLLPIFVILLGTVFLLSAFNRSPKIVCSYHHVTSDELLNRIDWREGHRLDWADFQGDPDYDNYKVAAMTSSIIQFKHFCNGENLTSAAKAIFVKDESWVRADATTEHYLEHEQMHFDITEIFARQLRKLLAENEYKCYEVDELERQANIIFDEWRASQLRYDRETSYSLNERGQRKWSHIVAENLDLYKAY